MKNTVLCLLTFVKKGCLRRVFFILLILTQKACSKSEQLKDPVDTLPPITQTGENTFACLINGKPFFSSRDRGASYFNGYLGISGSRRDSQGLRTVIIRGWEIGFIEEGTYVLKSEQNGSFHGTYLIDGGLTLDATTSDPGSGSLTITRFDFKELIVSGTFEFTILDNGGNQLHFTEGRFDLPFR
ncbi:DUF6252 family protein [Flagellimonas sp.]|uniref:DUF6252 family protein n=1 Tax=Flagellimonas sp. TaxID=2058762 RepID=UPI003BB1F3DB